MSKQDGTGDLKFFPLADAAKLVLQVKVEANQKPTHAEHLLADALDVLATNELTELDNRLQRLAQTVAEWQLAVRQRMAPGPWKRRPDGLHNLPSAYE